MQAVTELLCVILTSPPLGSVVLGAVLFASGHTGMGVPWATSGKRMCEVPGLVPGRIPLHKVAALAWLPINQGIGDDAVPLAVGDLPVFDVRICGTCWHAVPCMCCFPRLPQVPAGFQLLAVFLH